MSAKSKLKKILFYKPRSTDYTTVKIRTETRAFGGIKTLIVGGIIFLQLAILICLYTWLNMAYKWYMILSFVLTIITCCRVITSRKNGLSKAVWILFLLLTFSFGYVIYLLSDERIFFRRTKKKYDAVFACADKFTLPYTCVNRASSVNNDCAYLYSAGKFSAYKNCRLNYYSSGAQLFDEVLECLKKAEKFVFMEFFIVSDGVLFDRIFDVLREKVAQGVDVRLIYDDMGSHGTLSSKMKKKMRSAGIKLQSFNKLSPLFSIALNYRDHRKIVVIDGKVAFTGGCNLADEYVNEKRMYGYWKDTGLKIEGEAIDALSLIFLRQWEVACGKHEDYAQFFNRYESFDNECIVAPYADGLDFNLPIGKNAYENMIAGATKRLYIMTPYFIPNDTLNDLLISKALSGVDVRIILPEVPDKSFVYSVSLNSAHKLIEYGVKVYTMKNAFVHSKLMLSENCVSIGSINIDLRSFYQQFECSVYTDDKSTMNAVLADFEKTFTCCNKMEFNPKKRRNIFYRAYVGALSLFAPLM